MYLEKCRLYDVKTWILFILTFLIGVGYIKAKRIAFIGDYMLRGMLALAFILLVIKVLSRINLGNKGINILGSISYEMYLTHGLAIHILKAKCGNIKLGVFILSSVVVTIVVSYIINLIDLKLIKKLRVNI